MKRVLTFLGEDEVPVPVRLIYALGVFQAGQIVVYLIINILGG